MLVSASRMDSPGSIPRREASPSQSGAAEYVDGLQASGRYSFREEEAAKALGGSRVARQAALRRLKKKARIVSPRRGFYVIVPPTH